MPCRLHIIGGGALKTTNQKKPQIGDFNSKQRGAGECPGVLHHRALLYIYFDPKRKKWTG